MKPTIRVANGTGVLVFGGTVQATVWQHLAVVRSSGVITLYLNGNESLVLLIQTIIFMLLHGLAHHSNRIQDLQDILIYSALEKEKQITLHHSVLHHRLITLDKRFLLV
ncbi:MAG: hypothetical protein CM15mV7_2560 [uncultured marine virus]|nr:MAG: hypothetical protein CM15mV7_2560 [uncultured marine virus]